MDVLTDQRRYPLLTTEAKAHLEQLRQHPCAPAWNHRCGDRLSGDGLRRVHEFQRALRATPPSWSPAEPPAWVYDFASRVVAAVPRYASLRRPDGAPAVSGMAGFLALPTTSRADLADAPWTLVPDDRPLDDLIVYDTSGRTGHPIVVPTHPDTSSMYLPLLDAALATRGVRLRGGAGRVAIVNVCQQRRTFTFACVSSFLDWAGCAKVNLAPGDWRDPDDCQRFLDDCDPWVYTGDPLAFASLASLPLRTRPAALVSTSMALLDGWRVRLEERFGCPVVDLYSLTESGPVAVRDGDDYLVLPHDLYVEVVDQQGRPCQAGQRGEVTLTGGRNPFVPLLRYRTGDWASIVSRDARPRLAGLEGRPPTLFRDADGGFLNNVDVTNALRKLPAPAYTVHQDASGDVTVRVAGGAHDLAAWRLALAGVFGRGTRVTVGRLRARELSAGKVVQHTSDIGWDQLP